VTKSIAVVAMIDSLPAKRKTELPRIFRLAIYSGTFNWFTATSALAAFFGML
jgi:hypothetical protein